MIWQPIETAPRGIEVLLFSSKPIRDDRFDEYTVCNRTTFWVGWLDLLGIWHGYYSALTPDNPSYWMPLPKPPNMAWQPIETAPKDGTVVDLWVIDSGSVPSEYRVVDAFWQNPAGWWAANMGYDGETGPVWKDLKPTHWCRYQPPPMPLKGERSDDN